MKKSLFFFIAVCIILLQNPFICSAENRGKNKKRRFSTVLIKDLDDFSKLRLDPSDEVALAFLEELSIELEAGIVDQTYRFVFQKINSKKRTEPFLEQKKKGVLLGFLRSPSFFDVGLEEQEPGSSWESTNSQAIIEAIVGSEERSRASNRAISTATKGVCGPIAITHSLLRLGLRNKEQTFEQQFLNPQNLQQILQYQGNRTGITIDAYEQAHKDLGASVCQKSGIVTTNSTRKMSTFNKQLAAKMASKNPLWDCGLQTLTELSTSGQFSLNHIEHVKSVKLKAMKRGVTSAVIQTVNGLDQGDKKTTIPSDPGINSWSINPKAKPRARFAGSTSQSAKAYKKGIPNPTDVQWICCRKP